MSEPSRPVIVDAVVKDGAIRFLHKDRFAKDSARAAKAWGEGRSLRCRIEPEEDAISYQQMKAYFGHILEPVVQYTGYRKDELHAMLKAQFMPDDGRTSITQLSHEEMAAYKDACEQWARQNIPDAFALYDRTA